MIVVSGQQKVSQRDPTKAAVWKIFPISADRLVYAKDARMQALRNVHQHE